jgi:hypothetical protein
LRMRKQRIVKSVERSSSFSTAVQSAEQGNPSRADIAHSFRTMSGQAQHWQCRQENRSLTNCKHVRKYTYINWISSIPIAEHLQPPRPGTNRVRLARQISSNDRAPHHHTCSRSTDQSNARHTCMRQLYSRNGFHVED